MFAIVGTALRSSTRALLPITPCIRRKITISTSTMGAVGRHTVNTTERLAALRELMARDEQTVGAFVVPSEDQRERSDRCPIYGTLSRELLDQIPANTSRIAIKDAPSFQASMDLQV
jgi:hypothetical protein